MHRPNFRHPAPPGGTGPRPGGFRSPTAGFENAGAGGFPPPAWPYPPVPPSFGPMRGQYCGSPNTPPRDFYGNNGNVNSNSGGKGRFYHSPSPGHTQQRPSFSPRQTPPYKQSPYHSSPGQTPPYKQSPYRSSPGQHMSYQGSPRTSTPFGSTHGRERVTNVEKYYSPSMLQDPWASLQPVPVTDAQKCSAERLTDTSRKGRYFN